ncbi:HNH endonuclease [Rubripirellula obstinata]|uniref:HNH endonuclease n=1 Tax=Rubripirellula obstinata TaxID=406547 RepID=A0A5B1CKT1_9BACT|nr:HNH endonuclease [Rubripirellula obstinata]
MDKQARELVRKRAGGVCEYCRISGEFFHLQFQVEHIIAKKHRGGDEDSNLAFSCDRWK